MGQINERPRKDGTVGYTVQVRKKKAGKTVFNKTETFSSEAKAKAWMKKIEKDLEKGLVQRTNDRAPLAAVIDLYLAETEGKFGKTKEQCLRAIKDTTLGTMRCIDVTSEDILEYIRDLATTRMPRTTGNYLSHLAAVFAAAPTAYKAGPSMDAFREARITASRLKLIGKSGKRSRRLTLAELNRLMGYFADVSSR